MCVVLFFLFCVGVLVLRVRLFCLFFGLFFVVGLFGFLLLLVNCGFAFHYCSCGYVGFGWLWKCGYVEFCGFLGWFSVFWLCFFV